MSIKIIKVGKMRRALDGEGTNLIPDSAAPKLKSREVFEWRKKDDDASNKSNDTDLMMLGWINAWQIFI
jgi:hypothetical protein